MLIFIETILLKLIQWFQKTTSQKCYKAFKILLFRSKNKNCMSLSWETQSRTHSTLWLNPPSTLSKHFPSMTLLSYAPLNCHMYYSIINPALLTLPPRYVPSTSSTITPPPPYTSIFDEPFLVVHHHWVPLCCQHCHRAQFFILISQC